MGAMRVHESTVGCVLRNALMLEQHRALQPDFPILSAEEMLNQRQLPLQSRIQLKKLSLQIILHRRLNHSVAFASVLAIFATSTPTNASIAKSYRLSRVRLSGMLVNKSDL